MLKFYEFQFSVLRCDNTFLLVVRFRHKDTTWLALNTQFGCYQHDWTCPEPAFIATNQTILIPNASNIADGKYFQHQTPTPKPLVVTV